jgi:hypothetical protein
MGLLNFYIKDSNNFVNMIKIERIGVQYNFVSFDMVSLFTKIPLDETMQIINEVTYPRTMRLTEVRIYILQFPRGVLQPYQWGGHGIPVLSYSCYSLHGALREKSNGVLLAQTNLVEEVC